MMQSLPTDLLELLQYEVDHGPVAENGWRSHIDLHHGKDEEPRISALREYITSLCYEAREAYGVVPPAFLTGVTMGCSAHGWRLIEASFIRSQQPNFNQKLNECNKWMTYLRKKYAPLRPRRFLPLIAPRHEWNKITHETIAAIYSIDQLEHGSIVGIYETTDYSSMPETYFVVKSYNDGQFKMFEKSTCMCFSLQRHLDIVAIDAFFTEDEMNELYQFPFRYQTTW